MKAIALSQTLGFGALTSALVRWRCLPALPLGVIARLSAAVSLSFLASLAVIAAVVVPFSGLMPQTSALVLAGACAIVAMIALARIAHRADWISVPMGRGALLALLVATAADTAFAAAALWVLWPDAVSFQLLFAAYLIALGAGLVSNAPGGVGAFDLTLLALLPVSDDAAAMAAVLAFRVIYYALPAGVALVGLVRPAPGASTEPLDHPEDALLTQSALRYDHGTTPLLTLPSWRAGTIFGSLPDGADITQIAHGGPKSIYKCSAQEAVAARRIGWTVLRCAKDAVLDPQCWAESGPARRQLRRALRAFDTTDLQIREARDPSTLRDVATDWAANHGGERGLSMGRYCPDYLRQQRVFAAYRGAIPVAFVSFHHGAVWTLDLMRHTADTPTGAMQSLIVAAINAARADGVTRLSLSSVPAPAPHLPLAQRALTSSAGLRRFKSSFGPVWQPRYICATNPATLALTMATLAYGIHKPPKLARLHSIQPHHEDFSFARLARACEPLTTPSRGSDHD